MQGKVAHPDQVIAALAAGQHGVIAYGQLRGLGLTNSAIEWRVRAGRLHRLFRGVYAVGQPSVGPLGLWKAATLALGEHAVLSHISAAMLWRLLPANLRHPHVTLPRGGGRARRSGLVVHTSGTLDPGSITRERGIPVTTPERTLADMAATEPEGVVGKATRQANWLGLALGDSQTDGTFGDGEPIFLSLLERHGLPEPEVNGRVGAYRVDFLWRPQSFGVEADDWKGHRGRQAFEDDHDLGLYLMRRGIELLPLTYRQITKEEGEVAEVIRERLSRPPSLPRGS